MSQREDEVRSNIARYRLEAGHDDQAGRHQPSGLYHAGFELLDNLRQGHSNHRRVQRREHGTERY